MLKDLKFKELYFHVLCPVKTPTSIDIRESKLQVNLKQDMQSNL